MQTPIVTDADRQRGWAELEIDFTDGKRESVRVHALDQADLLSLAKLSPAEAWAVSLQKSLRVDPNFVARICLEHQCAISAMLAVLVLGNAGGVALLKQAAQLTAGAISSKG